MRGRSCRLVVALVVFLGASGVAAAAEVPLAGSELRIRNRPAPADPDGRKITWTSTDADVIAGARGSMEDPRCSAAGGSDGGGTLRVFSDRSADSTQDTGEIFLPCGNWSAIGRDVNPTGYVYLDRDGSDGPCKRISVVAGRRVKASCAGVTIAYDLQPGVDEGRVVTLLRVGATNRYCALFDAANGNDGSDGRDFRGRRSPVPATCQPPFQCGDGILVAGETCDDANGVPGDGCDDSCQVEDGYTCTGAPSVCALICSDGTLDPGETCDDGDLDAGDGCDGACQVEAGWECAGEPSACTLSCADGTLDAGETCDDGALTPGDGCDAGCQTEEHWSCIGEPSVCTTPCGDGFVRGDETCDDGGTTPGDGCSDGCAIEPGFACAGEPSVCTAGCGDGTVAGSEECDDGNATAGDGCSPHCAYEPLCLVTRDGGNPSHASLTKITRDGTVTPIGGVALPGNDTFGRQTLARCGRRIYFNLREVIAGLEVGLDGTLTPLPSYTLTEPGQINFIDDISCSPVQDVVVTMEAASLFFGQATSYRVDAGTGALTQAGRVQPVGSAGGRYHSDFHPITNDLYFATIFDPPLGATPLQAWLGRIVIDPMGGMSLAEQYSTQPGPFTRTTVDGIEFTEDGGELLVFAYFDGTQTCFGQFDMPGTTLPPLSALNRTCGFPTPVNDRWFAPRPEGGPLFYFAGNLSLFTGSFDPPTFDVPSSLVGLTEGRLLLGFDGRVIVLLNAVDGTVDTYDVASDLVTVTPNDSAPIGASPRDGVLVPCPDI